MLLTFVLGVACGWGAGFVEPHVKSALSQVMADAVAKMEPVELRTITLAVCLLAAALLAWVFATSPAVPLALGAVIGALGPRLREKFRAARAPDYDS